MTSPLRVFLRLRRIARLKKRLRVTRAKRELYRALTRRAREVPLETALAYQALCWRERGIEAELVRVLGN